jgi:electron transfer flavoprotein alpha subunit
MNEVVICFIAAAGYDKSAQGLAGAGRRLAVELGGTLRAIVVGPDADVLAGNLSRVAHSTIIIDQPEFIPYQPEVYLEALATLCRERSPRIVLLANDAYSQELAARLAYRLHGSAVGDATEIHVDTGSVRVTRQVYGGKAQAVIELKRVPAVVWLRARSFAPPADLETPGEVTRVKLEINHSPLTRMLERQQTETSGIRLDDAAVIVSGGRGIGDAAPFTTELQPLADLMKAALAASRAACDAGWVPPSWQVGQTGKKVAPELYLAIAIAGASQHIAGISEARNIAAINIDPDAPIFKHCRFGIVEDYRKVVPLLREKLGALQK